MMVSAARSSATVTAGQPTQGRRIRGLDADQRRLQRRDHLLDAATALFAERGYHNTAIEQICQNAFVGTKAFYELFENKEALYIALLAQVSEQIEARVVAELAVAPDDEADAVTSVISAFAHALVDDPRVARVTFGEAAGISPAVERQRRKNRRWAAAFLQQLWRQYDADSTTTDYRALAIATIGGMFELVADWLQPDGNSSTVEGLVDDLTTFAATVRRGIADADTR
ncbi:TetR/AcrR family transcriptional regulator [Antrihabitans stalagmiti]|nr:TetR/AcrR family transcriptional regulator [Antrihabitans stalagmiti]